MAFGRKSSPLVVYQCEFCGERVSPFSKGIAQRVVGWVAPRSGGGPNHIRHQTKLAAFAHLACISENIEPAKALQDELF